MTTQQRLILVLVVAAVLAGLTASATAQPFSGGLPLCQRNVNTCNASLATCSTSLNQVQASLTTCNTDLNACNTQLSECQAAAQNAPPGAGVEVILNFEDLRADNTQVNLHGPVYGGVGRNPLESFAADICTPPTQDCFSLVARHFSPVANPPRFTTLGTLRLDFPGSTALSHGITLGETVLARTDGASFDLLQIDLAELPGRDSSGNPVLSGPFSVTFYGIRKNGQVLTETTAVTNSVYGFERFVFSQLRDLIAVSWFQAIDRVAHQFDNIMVRPR